MTFLQELISSGKTEAALAVISSYNPLMLLTRSLFRLAERGGNILEAMDPDTGETPLHCAVRHGNLEIVTALLKAGVSLNARSTKRVTALGLAIELKQDEAAILLLNAGADAGGTILDSKNGASYLDQALFNQSSLRLLNLLVVKKSTIYSGTGEYVRERIRRAAVNNNFLYIGACLAFESVPSIKGIVAADDDKVKKIFLLLVIQTYMKSWVELRRAAIVAQQAAQQLLENKQSSKTSAKSNTDFLQKLRLSSGFSLDFIRKIAADDMPHRMQKYLNGDHERFVRLTNEIIDYIDQNPEAADVSAALSIVAIIDTAIQNEAIFLEQQHAECKRKLSLLLFRQVMKHVSLTELDASEKPAMFKDEFKPAFEDALNEGKRGLLIFNLEGRTKVLDNAKTFSWQAKNPKSLVAADFKKILSIG